MIDLNDVPFQNTEACIIFVDIINSSSFSSFVSCSEYMKWVVLFQKTFSKLAKDYFGDDAFISTAGDEGYLFLPNFNKLIDKSVLLFKAVSFTFELKTLIKLLPFLIKDKAISGQMPYGIRLAVGIHYGSVSYTFKPVKGGIEIEKYYGYNINFAKRIETSSRDGVYSNIYVSKEVYEALKSKKPLFFQHYRTEMKGIDKSIDVYEIRSAFIGSDIPMMELLQEDWTDVVFKDVNEEPFNGPITRHEPWYKSYLISVIFQMSDKSKGHVNHEHYMNLLNRCLFTNLEADDPMIDFVQALEYQKRGDLTLSVGRMKRVLQKYPEFVYARIEILKVMLEIVRKPNNATQEIIYIRDSTNELLNYFGNHLTSEERKSLSDIYEEIKQVTE